MCLVKQHVQLSEIICVQALCKVPCLVIFILLCVQERCEPLR
jgi:hypothetical protein